MILDIIAYSVLLAIWIFGVAAFLPMLDNWNAPYKKVLKGWIILNGIVIGIILCVSAVIWALARVIQA